ncbi:MAG: cobalt transporter CbiM [Magnetococcales bacterium]|nr:cobalt transporter CbiM [Magnetococcales bacterium]
MHVVDGVLSVPVLALGGLAAVGGITLGLKQVTAEQIPRVAMLSAASFLITLIHIPIGPSSVHMVLNGIIGLLLGWAAFPVFLVGLLLDAIFLGFGGLLSLGVNLSLMALPAVAVHYLFISKLTNSQRPFLWGAFGGGLAIASTGVLAALALGYSSDAFLPAAKVVLLSHLPLVGMEAFVSGSAIALMSRVKPELFNPIPQPQKSTV